MNLEQFEMERFQSTWENLVRFNLAESGVHPVPLADLISDPTDRDEFLALRLGYSQANGTPDLRRAIAALYPGATEQNVLATTGTAEANFLASWVLTEPGDEVIVMVPNYQQIWGLVKSFGGEAKRLDLVEELNWAPDLDDLDHMVSTRTKLICVCNPNNPTGAVLTDEEMNRIVATARRVGAWVLADEVYRGAELDRQMTPSFWGKYENKYEKLIVTCGLSKAYGLPGLRIGWILSSPEFVERAWAYHDYTTIGPTPMSDLLARIALRPEKRASLLERTRSILNANFPIIREWIDSHGGTFSLIEPRAGAIAYLRYDLDIDSGELVERLRQEKSVLICSGEHFLMENYLRIGFGEKPDYLRSGLELISSFVSGLK